MFDSVYQLVKKIPRGKVMTYGQIVGQLSGAWSFGLKNLKTEKQKNITPRIVGIVLHKNPDPENIPCHRVVNRDGKVAAGYAFGGAAAQRRKLLREGVEFKYKMHVDLKKCLWSIY